MPVRADTWWASGIGALTAGVVSFFVGGLDGFLLAVVVGIAAWVGAAYGFDRQRRRDR